MDINVFGLKIRAELIIIAIVILWLANLHLISSCSRVGLKEGLSMLGSSVDYRMGTGVLGSWDTDDRKIEEAERLAYHRKGSEGSRFVGPEESMSFLGDTQFSPQCCGSKFSSKGGLLISGGFTGGGCACMTPEQIDYLNTRGGNRTHMTEF